MKPRLPWFAICLTSLLILMLACKSVASSPTEVATEVSPTEAAPAVLASEPVAAADPVEKVSQAETWMQGTLALRSVTMKLEPIYGGESDPVSVQVDAAGNIHLTMSLAVPETVAATPDLKQPGNFELFIIGGIASTRIGTDEAPTPDDTYLTMLEDLLLGSEGPGMWLDLLPADSFTAAGAETHGGFATTKYSVDGQLADDHITGTIWIDDGTSALVGADLLIPEGLYYPPGSGLSGDVQIKLAVEKTNIAAITLP